MKKYILILLTFIGSFVNAQDYDFQELCTTCAESNGYYCGDDPANWTQYSPLGCVINSWLNDGWVDCIDAGDETGEDGIPAVPTLVEDCVPPPPDCDTIYVEVPVIEIDTVEVEVPFYIYETIVQFDTIVQTEYITQIIIDTIIDLQFDTIYNTEYITQIVVDTIIEEVEVFVPEYIYVTDTVYAEILDTLFIDVIQEVEVVVYDTIIETEIEYVEFFITDTITQYDTIVNTEYIEIFVVDSIIEYIEIINTEYVDCDTGMPCNSSIMEIVDKSKSNGVIYNINGQAIREKQGLYIENGKIYYKTK
tara:strand:- start:227 stop:1144 length:918 start_codon:yes stop_codon:yes gene_type:complete